MALLSAANVSSVIPTGVTKIGQIPHDVEPHSNIISCIIHGKLMAVVENVCDHDHLTIVFYNNGVKFFETTDYAYVKYAREIQAFICETDESNDTVLLVSPSGNILVVLNDEVYDITKLDEFTGYKYVLTTNGLYVLICQQIIANSSAEVSCDMFEYTFAQLQENKDYDHDLCNLYLLPNILFKHANNELFICRGFSGKTWQAYRHTKDDLLYANANGNAHGVWLEDRPGVICARNIYAAKKITHEVIIAPFIGGYMIQLYRLANSESVLPQKHITIFGGESIIVNMDLPLLELIGCDSDGTYIMRSKDILYTWTYATK